jgi:hypothetical protein
VTEVGGVEIIDLRDPKNPQLAAHWSYAEGEPPPSWNLIEDIQVKDGIGYFASDSGGGVFVVDVRNPFAPVLLAQITSAMVGCGPPCDFDHVHNVFVDGNHLYLASLSSHLVPVFDVTNPGAPSLIQTISTGSAYSHPSTGISIHDITARNGKLYACDRIGGRIYFFDVSNLSVPAPALGWFSSGPWTHSCWPTDDGKYLAVATEPPSDPVEGNKVRIWNVTNPSVVTLAQTITRPSSESPSAHNPVFVGNNRLYVSWYQSGLLAYDVTETPQGLQVQQVGEHDAFTDPDTVNHWGYWGVYPFLGPDRILASDTKYGLYVLSNQATHPVVLNGGETVTGKDFKVTLSAGGCGP